MADPIAQCKAEIAQLKQQIAQLRPDPEGYMPMRDLVIKNKIQATQLSMRKRRILTGHFGKIYALQWATNSRYLVSASQDGRLIVWNVWTTNKLRVLGLKSTWVLTVAYAPSGDFVASGGLDNTCSVFKLPPVGQQPEENAVETKEGGGTPASIPKAELKYHTGYVSGVKFTSDTELLTSSGDYTCALWDIETKKPKSIFADHKGEVSSLSLFEPDNGTFVSGAADATCKLWDHRQRKAVVSTFVGHSEDINAVETLRGTTNFASAADDSSIRLFDVRACNQLHRYQPDNVVCGVTSVSFSGSGRYLFGGYDDYNCRVFDTRVGCVLDTLSGHMERVSCLGVCPNGKALATGSWDQSLKVWA